MFSEDTRLKRVLYNKLFIARTVLRIKIQYIVSLNIAINFYSLIHLKDIGENITFVKVIILNFITLYFDWMIYLLKKYFYFFYILE